MISDNYISLFVFFYLLDLLFLKGCLKVLDDAVGNYRILHLIILTPLVSCDKQN